MTAEGQKGRDEGKKKRAETEDGVTPPVVQRYDHLFKLILIGDQSVGKTNLTMQFCDMGFGANYVATIGIDFRVKTINIGDKRIKLQIWDTAGQERFKTISRIYYRGAQGVLFVFDITNRTSFDNVRHWVTTFEEVTGDGSDCRKIMVGNKVDQYMDRKVPRDLAEMVAERYGMKYYETSAKTGSNVQLAFTNLATEILAYQEQRRANHPLPSTVVLKPSPKGHRSKSRRHSSLWSKCSIL